MAGTWMKEITADMLPDSMYRVIAEEIGLENLIKLTKLIGGATFYLPSAQRILLPVRNSIIRGEYNGYNIPQLSRKYEISQRQIYEIVKSHEEDKTK